jgi:hypothetical protein
LAREIVASFSRSNLDSRGRVAALIGPWGSGKSSVLNLVEYELRDRADWTVVRFNPWAVTGLDPLLRDFFMSISESFKGVSDYHELRRALARYADAVAPWVGVLRTPAIDPERGLAVLARALRGESTVDDLRTQVANLLTKSSKKLLFVIDDVDRLYPNELLLVFKLVRLVASLPRVDYLMAFDEETVISAIGDASIAWQDSRQSRAYLEKIVQSRFYLPALHSAHVDSLFNYYFDGWLRESGAQLSPDDIARLSAAYYVFIAPQITPRRLKAMFAEASPPMSLLGRDANPIDVLLLSYLHSSKPQLFERLRSWKSELTKSADLHGAGRLTKEQRRAVWETRLREAKVPDGDLQAVLSYLAQMFLPIKGVVEGYDAYTTEFWVALDRDRRIGSYRFFDRYFDQGLAPGELSDAAIDEAIAAVGTDDDINDRTFAQLVHANPDHVLDRLFASAERIPVNQQLGVIAVLAAEYPALSDKSGFALPPRRRVEQWTAEAILRASRAGALEIESLRTVGAVITGLRLLVSAVDIALADPRRSGEEIPYQLEELRSETLALVEGALEELRKSSIPDIADGLLSFLFSWSRIDSPARVRNWVAEQIAGGQWTLLDLAALCVPIAASFTLGTSAPPSEVLGDFQFETLDSLVDPIMTRQLTKSLKDFYTGEIDRADVSMDNRRALALRALKQRVEGEATKFQPSPNFTHQLLAANSMPYATLAMDGLPIDHAELSEHALDVAQTLASRLNPEATSEHETPTSGLWVVSRQGDSSPQWMLWIYPGPVLVVRYNPPIRDLNGRKAFAIDEIVSTWTTQITQLGASMRELGKSEVRVGLSLQTTPTSAAGDLVGELDFGKVLSPGRRSRPQHIVPWSHFLGTSIPEQYPADFEEAITLLVRHFQYREPKATAKALLANHP